MIISHKHRFIFLKTAKTAGTSVEIALSRFCGDDDVITPISPEDEKLRQSLGHRGPQNYRDVASLVNARHWKYLVATRRRHFYNHIGARHVRSLVAPSVWQDYYKFCFARNPWDRVVSYYHFHYGWNGEPRRPISEFIRSPTIKALRTRGFEVYTIRCNVVVDKVCRYEALETELQEVYERVGIHERVSLPMAKANYRTDTRHYREIFSCEDKDLIAQMFADEIRLLGYEY